MIKSFAYFQHLHYFSDTIQFGASTRFFSVMGPEEFERGALAEKRVKEKAATLQAQAMGDLKTGGSETRVEQNNEGIFWGIDLADSGVSDKDDHVSRQPLETMDIPEKYQNHYERIMAKKHKLENLRRETGRIKNKSSCSELTEGQTAQLEKNEKREGKLTEELDELERELRDKVSGRSKDDGTDIHLTNKSRRENEDDTDDFYDRTMESSDKTFRHEYEDVETEQSLSKKWQRAVSQLKSIKDNALNAGKKVAGLKSKIAESESMEDDIFFLKNDLEIAQDNSAKILRARNEVEHELATVEKMLKLVNDKLVFDRSAQFVGEKATHDKPKGPLSSTVGVQISVDAAVMPPPPPLHHFREVGGEESLMMPPSQRKRRIGPDVSKKETMPPPLKQKRRTSTQPGSTLSAISTAQKSVKGSSIRNPGSIAQMPGQINKLGSAKVKGAIMLDPRKDNWRAPEGQDGTGMTALNRKFAGRY